MIAVKLSWALCQQNVKNTFLYGDLQNKVYMEQPPCYVVQEKIRSVISKNYIWSQVESKDIV